MSQDRAVHPGDDLLQGLPETLPGDERLLWQGRPDWRALAQRAFHIRPVAGYFGLLVLWSVASGAYDGLAVTEIVRSAVRLAGLGAGAAGLLALLAWLSARSAVYSITSRRVVMRVGVALPLTVNLPFVQIESAAVRGNPDGTGDIPLRLTGSQRIAYLLLWPHVRPWRFTRAEPMLRAIPDAQAVAATLAQAMAASTSAQPRARTHGEFGRASASAAGLDPSGARHGQPRFAAE